jgi:hypothetical protein
VSLYRISTTLVLATVAAALAAWAGSCDETKRDAGRADVGAAALSPRSPWGTVAVSQQTVITPITPTLLHGHLLLVLDSDGVGVSIRGVADSAPRGAPAVRHIRLPEGPDTTQLSDALARWRAWLDDAGVHPLIRALPHIVDPTRGINVVHPEGPPHSHEILIALPPKADYATARRLVSAAFDADFNGVGYIVRTPNARTAHGILWQRLLCMGGDLPFCKKGQEPGSCPSLFVSIFSGHEEVGVSRVLKHCRPGPDYPRPEVSPAEAERRAKARRARLIAQVEKTGALKILGAKPLSDAGAALDPDAGLEAGPPDSEAPEPDAELDADTAPPGFDDLSPEQFRACSKASLLVIDDAHWQRVVDVADKTAQLGLVRLGLH